jgi:hypothetical protein
VNPFELLILLILVLLPLYFLPTLIAWRRKHPQFLAISLLNLFAGWTFIGWIGSLIWSALTLPSQPARAEG